MADPWMKFYPSDWRADPALRMCSLAARGLWIEMLGIMHDAAQYGHLLIANRAPTDAQLAVLIGATPDQITELIGELESAAVFSRTRKGVIFSRRMVRDAKRAETARKNGKKGGNPSLRKQTEKQAWDNPPDKGGDKAQKPEARSQIEDDDHDARARAREPDRHRPPPDPTLRERILRACGADPVTGLTGPSGSVIGTRADMHAVARWRADLGLDVESIIAVIADVMARKRDGPPARLTYFDKPMQAEAARRAERPLKPAEDYHDGRQPSFNRREAAATDRLGRVIDAAARNRAPSPSDIPFG